MRTAITLITLLIVLLSPAATAFALTDSGGGNTTTGTDVLGATDVGAAPRLKDIMTPVIRVINIALLAGGLVFVIMLFWSGYRFSLAQGDPKTIVLAKESITHAIQGFVLVIGAFALINIVSGLFGIQNIGDNLGGGSESAIQELEDLFNSSGQL